MDIDIKMKARWDINKHIWKMACFKLKFDLATSEII